MEDSPAPFVEALSRGVDGDGEAIPREVKVNPEVRVILVHGGALPIALTELIADGVLGSLGNEEGVIESRLLALGLNAERSLWGEEAVPGDGLYRFIEGILIVGFGAAEAPKHPNGGPQMKIGAPSILDLPLEIDSPDLAFTTREAECLDLFKEQELKSWSTGDEEAGSSSHSKSF